MQNESPETITVTEEEYFERINNEDMFGPINTPQKETTVKNDIKDTLNRIEDKVDAVTNYLEGRRALYNDFYADEINEAELDAGLRRLWFRLKEV